MAQPENFNPLTKPNYKFILSRAPATTFFVIRANLPSLSLSAAQLYTPFKDVPIPGDKMDFGTFDIEFTVDENMQNYLELFRWMMGLGFPNQFPEYAALKNKSNGSNDGLTSDATLSLLTSSRNKNIEVVFQDIWPTSISALDVDSQLTSPEQLSATASFNFKIFDINVVT